MAETGTINELAEILVMDRTTLTCNLKPLDREGWLKIEPGQDQRTRLVSLTPNGKAALIKALTSVEKGSRQCSGSFWTAASKYPALIFDGSNRVGSGNLKLFPKRCIYTDC